MTGPRCMKSEPTWMSDNYDLFRDLSLGDLTLVYTHDAAAYKYKTGEENTMPNCMDMEPESMV